MPIVPIADVSIRAPGCVLSGSLAIPHNAIGIVVFAHGSGSGRFSPRNRQVARSLQQSRLATLLLDLLTVDENERDRITAAYRFVGDFPSIPPA